MTTVTKWNSDNEMILGVQKIVPRLCCCYGGAVDSVVSIFTQLHRSGFKFVFEALYESI